MEINELLAGIFFSDIEGFSSLSQPEVKAYLRETGPDLAEIIAKHRDHLIEVNTWGDGLFLTSSSVARLAHLAIEIREYYRKKDWASCSLPELKVRIALHAGQVYQCDNLVKKAISGNNAKGCFGPEVNLAARIEPVTPPNHIWVSKEFKAVAAGHISKLLEFEAVGLYPLAKGAGTIEIWHLRTRDYDAKSPIPPKPIKIRQLLPDEPPRARYKIINDRIGRCKDGELVRMIAITGRGALLPYLLPHERLADRPVLKALSSGAKVHAIVLDPDCAEAVIRSEIESGKRPLQERLLQRDAYELRDTLPREYLDPQNHLPEGIMDRLDLRYTTIGIAFSAWIFLDMAVIEPHHCGKDDRKHLCHFTQLLIPEGTEEYSLLDKHFDYLWCADFTKNVWSNDE